MKIVIPGGSGQVGTILARHFHGAGHEVAVLSRSTAAKVPWRVVPWDARTRGGWGDELEGAEVVVNLVGRSVNCRYTPANRRAIIESRVRSTQLLGEAIASCARPPRVWLQASTATVYAHRYDAPNDERTGVIGGNEPNAPGTWKFSINVATAWEQALAAAETPRTRKVALRDSDEPRPRRRVRRVARSGAPPTRRARRGRPAVRVVGSRSGFRRHGRVPDPTRRPERRGQRVCAGTAPERRIYAGAPRSVGRAVRAARGAVDDRTRRVADADRIGTGAKEPARRAGAVARRGFAFRFPSWPEAARDLCRQWRERRVAR